MRCKWLTLASPQPQGKPHLRSLFVQAACKIVQACCFKMTILICATPLTMRPVSHFLSLYRPLLQLSLLRSSTASQSARTRCTCKNSPHRCRLFSVFQISWAYFNSTTLSPNMAAAVRNIWQLKPHSLSYQANTFTILPLDTLVKVESKVEPSVVWLKSVETKGKVL